MKKNLKTAKMPYVSPSIESSDFMVEAGIAESFPESDKNANDFVIGSIWDEQ